MGTSRFPDHKICYTFDEETRLYTGESVGYLLPPGDEPEYYAPPNSVYLKPRGTVGPGRNFKLNEKGTGWLVVEDYSQVPVWDKATSQRALQPQPGKPLAKTLTDQEPPACEPEEWPRWDEAAGAWTVGQNNAGVEWHNTATNQHGTLQWPWDELPEGAQPGVSPVLQEARNRVKWQTLLNNANDMLELCHENLALPTATTGDQETLANVKAYKKALLTANLRDFIEPPHPVLLFGQGDILEPEK